MSFLKFLEYFVLCNLFLVTCFGLGYAFFYALAKGMSK